MARAKRTIARRDAKREATKGQDRTVATNRRARHEYEILERLECGIVLQGSEVKSLREGTAQIADGYARVDDGELWLYQTHVPPWRTGVGFSAHDPDRRRKLLVHRREVDELLGRTRAQPLTLIPLRLYFSDGKVKVELALAKGKRLYDRRQALAKRDAELDMARAVRGAERDGRLHRE
jgi:SsrA-binding protein